jgi:hypothetical protein
MLKRLFYTRNLHDCLVMKQQWALITSNIELCVAFLEQGDREKERKFHGNRT